MLKNSIMIGALILALSGPATAALLGPQGAKPMTVISENATRVAWVCGPLRCVWRPGWHGVVPAFAIWGPPRLPGCVYERHHHHWVEICP
jgi:hypothetical protein